MRSATSRTHSTLAIKDAVPLSHDESEDLILKAYMSEDFRQGMDASLNKRSAELQSEVVLSGALQSSAKIAGAAARACLKSPY